MRWKTNQFEGWHTGFAVVPVQLDDGTTVWLESFRYYVNKWGVIASRVGGK